MLNARLLRQDQAKEAEGCLHLAGVHFALTKNMFLKTFGYSSRADASTNSLGVSRRARYTLMHALNTRHELEMKRPASDNRAGNAQRAREERLRLQLSYVHSRLRRLGTN